MRSPLSNHSDTYLARRSTRSSVAPTSASGGGSYVFSPVKPSGVVALEGRAAEPLADALGERLHLGSFGHYLSA